MDSTALCSSHRTFAHWTLAYWTMLTEHLLARHLLAKHLLAKHLLAKHLPHNNGHITMRLFTEAQTRLMDYSIVTVEYTPPPTQQTARQTDRHIHSSRKTCCTAFTWGLWLYQMPVCYNMFSNDKHNQLFTNVSNTFPMKPNLPLTNPKTRTHFLPWSDSPSASNRKQTTFLGLTRGQGGSCCWPWLTNCWKNLIAAISQKALTMSGGDGLLPC